MSHPLVRKIDRYTSLSTAERDGLLRVLAKRSRSFDARRDMVREGDRQERLFVIQEGWAFRYRTLPDGRRQIMAFLLPGDVSDNPLFAMRTMDHSIGVLSPLTVADLSHEEVETLAAGSPRIASALSWDTSVGLSIQREWTVSVGRRDATERMAHMFLEMLYRLRAVGLTIGDSFEMPATQSDLADALGITSVHTNRTLQGLRSAGLITLDRRRLAVRDLDSLRRIALFDPRYLHQDHEGRHLSASEA